eukprot:TRINITY_DN5762_c0_g1_i1.p1 TRINITY_DN5762_c0_g1~~TRINITY_DN5762_c0_g1_i1.p1  ORF type:complete len:538 (+),score=59.12 TRINITY_DN5762_c0_g1_i1:521-2134(+)
MNKVNLNLIVLIFTFLATILSVRSLPQVNIWPLPQFYTFGGSVVQISQNFSFTSNSNGRVIREAFIRYYRLSFLHGSPAEFEKPTGSVLSSLHVNVSDNSEFLQLSTDESYNLTITTQGSVAIINAVTVFGALRGLETFSQLVNLNFNTFVYEIENAPWTINDFPRFPHRGILMDSSRHFIPVPDMLTFLDSMSYAKLNVMHWHIVDAQSFPMQSKSFPLLWEGSWSVLERYTLNDVKFIVDYAFLRGIRVVPEFDGPGHAWAWGVGYPDLLPAGYNTTDNCDRTCPINPCNVPLDPSKNFTYQLLEGLYKEMTGGKRYAGIFFDDMFHLGGDEFESGCYANSQEVAVWMKQQGFTNFDQVFAYFINRTSAYALGFGRSPVYWDDVFDYFNNTLDKSVVFQVYLDTSNLQDAVAAGYRAILSNYDAWYLDSIGNNWTIFYNNEPLVYITDPSEQRLVIGGEVCNWGETMDPSDLFARIWPRSGAFAERVWSARDVNSTELAYPRILNFRCLLLQRGIDSAPVDTYPNPPFPGSCFWQ